MPLEDSPLSIAASIAGILTFLYALLAGAIGYTYLFRSFSHTDADIQRFYEAFSACALETDLVRRDILAFHRNLLKPEQGAHYAVELPMADNYLLDPDSLGRLFEQVRAVEIELQTQAARIVKTRPTGGEGFVGKVLGRGRWVTRADELGASLGKREALTARLLVIQMSLVSARLHSRNDAVEQLKSRVAVHEKEIAELKNRLTVFSRVDVADAEKASL